MARPSPDARDVEDTPYAVAESQLDTVQDCAILWSRWLDGLADRMPYKRNRDMAKNVEVEYNAEDGMLYFKVNPQLIVGQAKSGSEYVAQSERFGEDVPGAPGWKFNLAVWIRGASTVPVPSAPVVKRNAATPFASSDTARASKRVASIPDIGKTLPGKGIAPGKSQTVTINRVQG